VARSAHPKAVDIVNPNPGRPRRLSRAASLFLAVLSAGALAGCAMFRKLDMVEIHQEWAARPQRNPVILIHGFIGSKLRNARTHEAVWGGIMNAFRRGRTDGLDLPIDSLDLSRNRDAIVPYALLESVAGVKVYGAILNALRDVGGYRQGDIEDPRPGDTLFIYTYDWRRDNVESAIGLGRAIQRIKERLHAPDLRFDIVAHSMGGLVAQYYIGYGTEDVIDRGGPYRMTWAGAPNVGRMILIGTPLRGTMSAFRTLNTGFSRTMSPAVVFTMPSMYQLLPSDGRVHIIDPQGDPVDIDLYDADDWVRNRWSVFHPHAGAARRLVPAAARRGPSGRASAEALMRRFLQRVLDRARDFHAALAADAPGESPIPIHLFGSDCVPTLDRAVLKPTSSGPVILFDDEKTPERALRRLARQTLVPGDGTVTTGSLLGIDVGEHGAADWSPGSRTFASTSFFCESHGSLPREDRFHNNLFYVLFHSPERPAPVARASRGR
jgi:pimeloyl-ACP methyl ester carboxylesterase